MGAESSVDQLTIEIKGKADSAKSSLHGLADDLRKVGNASSGVAGKLDSVSTSLGKLGRQQNAINTANGLATAIGKLGSVKISPSIARQIDRIGNAMGGVAAQKAGIDSLSSAASSIAKLGSVKISSSIGRQLGSIASGMQAIDAAKFDPSKIGSLVTSLNGLSSLSRNSLGSTVNALRRVPEAAEALDKVDFSRLRGNVVELRRALDQLPAAARSASGGMRTASSSADRLSSSAKAAAKHSAGLSDALEGIARAAHMAMNVSTVIGVFGGISHAIASLIDKTNRYVEDMNLFNVAMGSGAESARSFADQASRLMGIQPQEWMRGQGTFATIAKGMGVAADKANVMSQQLTQLSYDLASFYNISVSDAMEKVQAGLVGQIRPLRELGYDLSDARLKEEAMALGIDENTDSMTQAEKAMLRYKAMLSQVTWAQGDMARTLDSPANALRIFKSQVSQAAVSIGTIFLPMLKAILPVATAAAKTVATLANMIANLTGGTQIAAIDYGGGGLSDGTSVPSVEEDGSGAGSGSGGSGSSPTAKKYKGIGDAAKKAAEDVKELKRQVMGFDEINKFNEQASGKGSGSGSGGNGSGGSGGSGSGSGGGNAAGNIGVQTYDFLGNNSQLNDMVRKMLEFAKRLARALDPLVEATRRVVAAIRKQFEGLDIAGAAQNAFAGFVNLLSNFARQCIEILGPLVVAFNFPATLAYSFDFAAQLCNTLSAAINALGSFIQNFNRLSITPLVAWIGDRLRGAISICIDELSKWQTWFVSITPKAAELGTVAGAGAGYVLKLAEAVGDIAFAAAAKAFTALGDAIRGVLTVLINSGAAKTAAFELGAVLTGFAITSGIGAALRGVGTAFRAMADMIFSAASRISGASREAKLGLESIPSGAAKAKAGIGDFKAALELLGETMRSKVPVAANVLKRSFDATRDAMTSLVWRAEGAGKGFDVLGHHFDTSRNAARAHAEQVQRLERNLESCRVQVTRAQESLSQEKAKLDAAKLSLSENATMTDRLKVKVQEQRVAQQEANLQIARGKEKMAEAKLAAATLSRNEQTLALKGKSVATAEREATAEIVGGIAKKGAAATASYVLEGAEKAAAFAAKGLKLAMEAIPGVALAIALQAVLDILSPLIDKATDFIKSLFGIKDASDEVSDTTQEATEVLSQEQEQVEENKQSIDDYCAKHDSFRDALEMSGQSSEDFAQRLTDIDETFDDLEQSQEQYVDSTINGFERIDTSTGASLQDVNDALRSNNQTMADWSTDLQGFYDAAYKRFGDRASDMVSYLENEGPSKMGAALKQFMEDPASEASQEFLTELEEAMEQTDPKMANALRSSGNDAENEAGSKGTRVGRAFTDGVDSTQPEAEQTASDVDDATVQKFGSHYGEAKDAGRNLAGGFGDGVREASADATKPAEQLCQSVVTALNGGKGYSEAKSAGRNVVGGYADGLREAESQAESAAKGIKDGVVRALNGGAGYSEAKSAGRNLLGGYRDGISEAAGQATSEAQRVRSDTVRSLNGGSGYSEARDAGRNMMGGFADGLREAAGSARDAGSAAARSAQDGMGSNYWGARDAGRNEMGGFIDGLRDGMGNQAWWKGRDAAVSAQNGAGSNYWGAYDAGKNFGYGFGDGIGATSWYARQAGRNLAIDAYNAAVRALDIHSPSKVMHKVGVFFGQGLAIGIEGEGRTVGLAAGELAEHAVGSAGDMMAKGTELGRSLGDGFRSGVGNSPVVLQAMSDLSAARSWTAPSRRQSLLQPRQHASAPVTSYDGLWSSMADAVERGVVSVAMGMSSSDQAPQTIVLRVDSEDLARATARGRSRLQQRFGIDFG